MKLGAVLHEMAVPAEKLAKQWVKKYKNKKGRLYVDGSYFGELDMTGPKVKLTHASGDVEMFKQKEFVAWLKDSEEDPFNDKISNYKLKED